MSGGKVSNFTDLIQRVTASCLLHPLGSNRFDMSPNQTPIHNRTHPQIRDLTGEEEDTSESETEYHSTSEEEDEEEAKKQQQKIENGIDRDLKWDEREIKKVGLRGNGGRKGGGGGEREAELVVLMGQVFDVISEMKKAYAKLQEAHCPWDPDKMRVADAAVVGELRRMGVLRERFRRGFVVGDGNGNIRMKRRNGVIGGAAGLSLREVVGPYEAAVTELQGEVKAKEVEIEELKEKLKGLSCVNGGGNGRKGRSHRHQSKSGRKVDSTPPARVPVSPSPDLFGSTMNLVIDASKSFTNLLLSLMRSAHWDIAAATRSIEAAASPATTTDPFATSIVAASPPTDLRRAKYALESYISRKMFLGFDHETFYMDGTLLSLIDPDRFRQDCFSKYHDMKSMDPAELLGITPTCQFGVFCSKKYLAIVHPNMESSLFGDLEQRRQVVAGIHPRTQFYREFLALAKTVWLLHLLAFSLEPPPNHFEASKGAEFHPMYMETVAKFPGEKVPAGLAVGFPVSPGFKLGNGAIVKARVYLVPRH